MHSDKYSRIRLKLSMIALSLIFAGYNYSHATEPSGLVLNNDEQLPSLGSDKAKTSEPTSTEKLKDKSIDFLANSAQQKFSNLTPEQLKQQGIEYAKGAAIGQVQSSIDNLLSPYGHIRTNIVINDHGDLNGSSADYFIPWFDNKGSLLFNQLSVHRTDDRTIGNFGVGVRQNIGDKWLVGGNLFYDYDFSRQHRRAGAGIEAWTDFLKVSSNYYIPLSGWRDSKDLADYEERPAKGYDIRIQGWIPYYPQIGASLAYEKYYGDQVALFGTDDLQKDPIAATVGVNYTPVPLVKLSVSYKKGTGDSDDLVAGAELNYQLGVPLSHQLDSSNVEAMHTLKGSRYDFVDRNNDIVLEYREKSSLDVAIYLKPTVSTDPKCIIADAPESATAYEGCKWAINAQVDTHQKIKSASWVPVGDFAPESTLSLPALVPDSIHNGDNNHWQFIFPDWDSVQSSGANHYKLALTLVDDEGHEKQSNLIEIIVTAAPRKTQLIIDNSPVSEKNQIKIDMAGQEKAQLTVNVSKQTTVDGQVEDIPADQIISTFYAYTVDDKSFHNPIKIYSSKNECHEESGCLYYVDQPEKNKSSIASTRAGIFAILASNNGYDTVKTNPVYIDFTAYESDLVTAIVDTQFPDVNIIDNDNVLPEMNHSYEFKAAYDSNHNGKWDSSDQDTLPDDNKTPIVSLLNYRWYFASSKTNTTGGTYAVNTTDNSVLTIPATNDLATSVLPGTTDSGVQGLYLRVDFQGNTQLTKNQDVQKVLTRQ
ncbi:inverse autotransporter beta domain-containing protein [Buttiauxella ferragutiae]|uniref:inverse autotransporter beta domain-containing protein n=1 Tax=Buttiauxella ferragutiae TaxID=82989 RepID=UPI003525FB8B